MTAARAPVTIIPEQLHLKDEKRKQQFRTLFFSTTAVAQKPITISSLINQSHVSHGRLIAQPPLPARLAAPPDQERAA